MQIKDAHLTFRDYDFKPNEPGYIIIHHAAAIKCTADAIHEWHLKRGWKGAAYQYFIDKKGIVWRMRQDHWNGGHVKGSLNRNSIGICCEGNYETETEMPTAQLTSLVQLVSFKMAEYNIPIDKVTPHKYHADTSCPGKNFPWIDFKSMTFNPIKQFQEEYGLKVDGIVGKRTIAKVLKLIQIIHTAREALKGERDGFNGSNEVHK